MSQHGQQVRCPANEGGRIRRVGSYVLSGFSLIELLIVITILLVLTTVYWNQGMGGNRKVKACELNLQKIHLALEIYANDFKGVYPVTTNARTSGEVLSVLVPRYTADTSIFICPASKDSPLPAGEPFPRRKISYAYYMGRRPGNAAEALMSDRQIDAQMKNVGERVFSDTGKPPAINHGKTGGNFLFCDGHVEFSPPRIPFSLGQTQGIVLLNP
jgi:prepilin-type N-terminal cleavage/methylation domain-containing protein/prepilin-type processing-associated H-X9-DG protein